MLLNGDTSWSSACTNLGNKLRRILDMATLSARRHNPAIRTFAQRLEASGILNAIVCTGTPWTIKRYFNGEIDDHSEEQLCFASTKGWVFSLDANKRECTRLVISLSKKNVPTL